MLRYWKGKVLKHRFLLLVIGLITFVAAYFYLYHIEFGLPHSFHADEPEIAELAIKYTYEIQDIIAKTELYRLTPISYVYGTFPVYLFTVLTMAYSKINGILSISFDKTSIYVFLRSVNALMTIILIPLTALIYRNLFGYKAKAWVGILSAAFLTALNWKIILHAHYLNHDIIITLVLCASYWSFFKYLDSKNDTKWTIITGILFGLAVGTKVTVLLTLPLYLAGFLYKKEPRNMFAFLFVIFGTFVATNPFSLSFANDFVFRVYTLSVKENGLVFDSVDSNFFKYFIGLGYIATPLVAILGAIGMYKGLEERQTLAKHIFLIATVVIYLVFFSTGTRRVDRWLLPLLPIIFVYASYIVNELFVVDKKWVFGLICAVLFGSYLYFPLLMLKQFDENTPKSAAYLWMRDNIPEQSNKLVITEEGLDPMNKLQGVYVLNYEVYESQNAQFRMPESPIGYDYIVLASRPMQNFKRPEVRNKYPFYYDAWNEFEETVFDEKQFKLIKAFELPKPNLIEVSDVYVFEAVK